MSRNKIFRAAMPLAIIVTIILWNYHEVWATTGDDSLTSTVKPEVVTRVAMSSLDTNRVVSSGTQIKDVVYSEEKGVVVKVDGKNAFIKFLSAEDPVTQERSYAETPTEFYIVCADNSVYTIIAIPRKIPAQTIYLESDVNRIKENLEVFSGVPFEKKVTSLIKSVYQESIPYRYDVKKIKDGKTHIIDGTFRVTATRNIFIPGEGIVLTEYHVFLVNAGKREMSEKNFLVTSLAKKPVAISLDRHVISGDQVARLFIVEMTQEG
jgi:conjugal transfer pilus assembly protein TraK